MELTQQQTRIDKILERIRAKSFFNPIKRFKYDVPIDEAMEIITAIGRERNRRFVIDDENRFAYENILKWVHGDVTAKCLNPDTKETIPANMYSGIYIAGNTGTGKSWCMELIREYILAMQLEFVIEDVKRPLSFPITRADDINVAFMKDGDIERFKNMEILCIQDVGTEARETLYMGNRVEVIRTLLEWRGDYSNKLTFITSNLPSTHTTFANIYGDRVVSRIRQMCNYYEIKGKDRRK